jgi:hypothetical protein
MIKRALIYGLAAAGGVFLWMMLEYALGFHTARAEIGRYTGFLALIFPVAAIAFGVRAARRARGGAIGFGEAFGEGIAIAATFSLLGAISVWLYFSAINPGFLASPAAGGATLGGQVALSLVSGLFLGGLVSLVAALLLRRASPAA